MKWLECIKSIANTNKAGKCPYCSGSNTDYTYVLVEGQNGYLDIWCNNCKKLGHISRVKIDKKEKRVIALDEVDKIIPKYKVTY